MALYGLDDLLEVLVIKLSKIAHVEINSMIANRNLVFLRKVPCIFIS